MQCTSLCTRTLSQPQNPSKQHRSNRYDRPQPVLFAKIQLSDNREDTAMIKVLVDSGASKTVVRRSLLKALRKKKLAQKVVWMTTAGDFCTKHVAVMNFLLPELNPAANITAEVHLVDLLGQYDMIIGSATASPYMH